MHLQWNVTRYRSCLACRQKCKNVISAEWVFCATLCVWQNFWKMSRLSPFIVTVSWNTNNLLYSVQCTYVYLQLIRNKYNSLSLINYLVIYNINELSTSPLRSAVYRPAWEPTHFPTISGVCPTCFQGICLSRHKIMLSKNCMPQIPVVHKKCNFYC